MPIELIVKTTFIEVRCANMIPMAMFILKSELPIGRPHNGVPHIPLKGCVWDALKDPVHITIGLNLLNLLKWQRIFNRQDTWQTFWAY